MSVLRHREFTPLLPRSRILLSLATGATTLQSRPRGMSSTPTRSDPFRPAKRVAGQKQDVWYCFMMLVLDMFC